MHRAGYHGRLGSIPSPEQVGTSIAIPVWTRWKGKYLGEVDSYRYTGCSVRSRASKYLNYLFSNTGKRATCTVALNKFILKPSLNN